VSTGATPGYEVAAEQIMADVPLPWLGLHVRDHGGARIDELRIV
jgi:hypothetical protein